MFQKKNQAATAAKIAVAYQKEGQTNIMLYLKLENLKAAIESGELVPNEQGDIKLIGFDERNNTNSKYPRTDKSPDFVFKKHVVKENTAQTFAKSPAIVAATSGRTAKGPF